ncbi:2214_t:CDS:2 [Diversispora eburnea]|uniref:2214_t:CDS:1 n=1 Tax=Diversispora eburnea TaxID=1213867 RepID=A0A9N8V9Q3_9GLOM|nr:2214_t:CDS:2 [Diversispora eburnea]
MATTAPAGLHLTDFVKRPGYGKLGRPIRVRTNYFEVISFPTSNIYHYDVTITPEVPPGLNRKIYKHFETLNAGALNNIKPVFDGRKNIFAARKLPFGETATYDVVLPEDDGVTTSKRPPRAFKVKLKKVAEINMEELERWLNQKSEISNNILTAIMALDVLIRHEPSMKYASVGRSFYTPEGSMALYGGAEVWQGYYQSVRPTPGKMMINVDLSATAFYQSGTLVQIVVKILGKRQPEDLFRGIDRERSKLERELKGLKVCVNHRDENIRKRRYKILKLTQQSADKAKFEYEGKNITVAQYFQKVRNIRLKYPMLPCVVVRKDTFFPMEICDVIPGQRHMRKLNEKQTADMIKFTCQQPHMRANKINQGIKLLNYHENEQMKQFHMQVANEMKVTNARVLPTPTINYHTSSRDPAVTPRDGSWNLRDKKVATGATLGSWSVIAFGKEHEFPMMGIQHFVRELINTCSDTGMNIPNKTPPIMHANPIGNVEESVKQAWTRAGTASKQKPQLILCILPNTGTQLYGEIKYASDTVLGVASQCVQGRHVNNPKKQYCANVCLKINVKLGGMNSYLSPNLVPFIAEKPSIMMGADVYHPGPGSTRPSIAALCASLDNHASRYASTIRVQSSREENIVDLFSMVKEMLRAFYQSCGKKPFRILFYRDGVSEGQFKKVLDSEIKSIKDACKSLDAAYNPKITFVVVQKRHHTRFFPLDRKDADRTGNCFPGTVVETSVVHPVDFDFYLQSQAGLQGTCRPAHYHVLMDENGFTPDSLQALSYNLCYIYARCTRSVSIVPPVYYAHLVCSRARFHSKSGNWSEESPEEEAEVTAASYNPVRPDLQKVMYFM